MSSESDNEIEFYDALEITPNRIIKPEDTLKSLDGKVGNESVSPKSSITLPVSKVVHKGKPLLGLELPKRPDHSLKNDAELILSTNNASEQSAQSLLQSLETTKFTKEKCTEMPPPSEPPPSVERMSLEAANRQRDLEESSSACSGSLLGNLGDDDEEIPRERLNRRRHRNKEVYRKINREDVEVEDMKASPGGSQSSSLEGVYPSSRTSHPFRVIETDTASVYSSMSLGKIGKILSGNELIIPSKETEKPVPSSIDRLSSEKRQLTISAPDTSQPVETVTLCQEPDLVASTRSSSGSDKSNSLPRTEPLPPIPATPDIPPTPIIPNSIPSSLTDHKLSKTCSIDKSSIETSQSFNDISSKTTRRTEEPSFPRPPHPPTVPTLPHPTSLPQPPSTTTHRSLSTPGATNPPIAPPRKKRRAKQTTNTDEDTTSVSSTSSLPVPQDVSNIDKISIGHSLDLRAAVRGGYLIKPQDSVNAKALGPSPEQVAAAEATAVSEAPSQASTPEVSRVLVNDGADHIPQADHDVRSTPEFPINPRTCTPISNTSHSTLPSHSSIPETGEPEPDPVRSKTSESPGSTKQLNMPIRIRSDSGKDLTDQEILQQVSVLNLDTGQRIPLSEAENSLPEALNPLSLHIMRITSEYVGASNGDDNQESDDESVADILIQKLPEIDTAVKKKTFQLKKFLGRKMESAVNKAKSLAHEVSHRNKEEKDVFEDETPAQSTMQFVKIKTSHSHKGPHEFDNLLYVQEISGEQKGPVWCMKFSGCGQLLATAGQDHVLRVWVLKTAFNYFLDIRNKFNADIKVSPTPSQESLVSQHSGQSGEDPGSLDPNDDGKAPFMPKPFCVYSGHTADMLDISWSKNYFMLTSSMDKTVRLWHISRKECLCIFQHMDFVTAIAFHPKDDRYFISGSLDGKLRLWSIPDKRVFLWNEVDGQSNLITAANFCQNGLFTVVGTYDGRCIFYETDRLMYHTTIHVRSTRGKNAKGRKITGIEPLPGEDKVLITSNDSRIRLYNLQDLNLSCKYKGYSNISSQIRAGFSHDGKFIVAGSENQCIYIWKTYHDYSKFSSARSDRNGYWEGVKAHSAVVTCSVFAPHPELIFDFIDKQESRVNGDPGEESKASASKDGSATNKGYVLVSADFIGCIKVFLKKEKPKHSSLPASAMA